MDDQSIEEKLIEFEEIGSQISHANFIEKVGLAKQGFVLAHEIMVAQQEEIKKLWALVGVEE